MRKTTLLKSVLACAFVLSGVSTFAQTATTTSFAVTKLTLVSAVTQRDIRQLTSGSTIDLSLDGTALSVRADVSGTVGSVTFTLDGNLLRTENVAPFTINGDASGSYTPWTPTIGSHKLRATPYQSDNHAGAIGVSVEVSFNVISSSTASLTTALASSTESLTITTAPLTMYNADGSLNLATYGTFALSYDKLTMEQRLGPSFLDLSPSAVDDRPTLYRPPSYTRSWGYIRTNPYEIGGPPVADSDYWSDSGQLGYVPDNAADPGLDRIQTYAYYDSVFAISPRLDWSSSQPHPDLQTTEPYYLNLFGEMPKYPIAMVRNYGMQQNEALVLYRDGYLACAGTQTSRTGTERPYPGFVFPVNKVPTGLAVTTANELALVTVWDINTHQGQLAVFALEGKYLPYHTWPYMGMPNQGSWSAFKLLGYVDLPMKTPTAIAAASNGWWSGPSQTNGLVLSQIDLANDTYRTNVYSGAWSGVVATGGYAVVSSLFDNKVAVVDLTPLFSYLRESYLSSATSYNATLAARGTGSSNFPQAFSVRPSITPKVVWQTSVSQPTAVLAGQRLGRWSKDFFKAYVASRDGTIRILDTSSIMKRFSWERLGTMRVAGSFNVGRNPTSMCFTRRGDSNLPLIPRNTDGSQTTDPLNNLFYIAVRGDRKVVAAVTFDGSGAVYRTIKDKRMSDPVTVSTAVRGPIVSVADFRGRKMISFRVGAINDYRHNKVYGCGADGTAPFEFAGELPFGGYPFLLNSTNVN
jgi:hypothetical protein